MTNAGQLCKLLIDRPAEEPFVNNRHTLPISVKNLGGKRQGFAPEDIFNDLVDDPVFVTIMLEVPDDILEAMDASDKVVRSERYCGIVIFAKKPLAQQVVVLEGVKHGPSNRLSKALFVEILWDSWLVDC